MNIYDDFYRAYNFYNKFLFDGKLGDIVITFVRKPCIKGYYSFSRFEVVNEKGSRISEISVNPDYFGISTNEQILSTLVHEMCHMYHDFLGKKCTSGYHDTSWSKIMVDAGLMPSSTGKAGGKKTGFLMSHYVIEGGKFDVLTRKLCDEGFSVGIEDVFSVSGETAQTSLPKNYEGRGVRYKYSCGCSNVWGKKNLGLKCTKCGNDFVICR